MNIITLIHLIHNSDERILNSKLNHSQVREIFIDKVRIDGEQNIKIPPNDGNVQQHLVYVQDHAQDVSAVPTHFLVGGLRAAIVRRLILPVVMAGNARQPSGQKHERVVVQKRVDAPQPIDHGVRHLDKLRADGLQSRSQNSLQHQRHALLRAGQVFRANVEP